MRKLSLVFMTLVLAVSANAFAAGKHHAKPAATAPADKGAADATATPAK